MFIGLALAGDATDGLPERTAPSGRSFADITEMVAGARTVNPPCDTDISFRPINETPDPECVFRAPLGLATGKRSILIGDSHAGMMSQVLRDTLLGAGYDVSIMTFGGCAPFPGFSRPGRDCDAANEAVYAHLETTPYDLVLVAGRTQTLSDEDMSIIFKRKGSGTSVARIMDLTAAGLHRLLALDGSVLYFDPIPEMPIDVAQYARKKHAFESDLSDIDFNHPYSAYLDRAGPMLEVLDRISAPSLTRVHTADILCVKDAEVCRGVENGTVFYADDNHLSRHGIALLVPAITAALAGLSGFPSEANEALMSTVTENK